MPKDKELMKALGIPSEESGSEEEAPSGGYLDTKPAELRTYLEDAVNPDLSNEQRAEALCKALEFKGASEEVVEESPADVEFVDDEEGY